MQSDTALIQVIQEYRRATKKFGAFNSCHEGFAILKEEVDELWDEVKRKDRRKDALKREGIQVCAMGLRFLVDCCEEE